MNNQRFIQVTIISAAAILILSGCSTGTPPVPQARTATPVVASPQTATTAPSATATITTTASATATVPTPSPTPTITPTFLAANSTPLPSGLILANPAVTGAIRNNQGRYLQNAAKEKYSANELNQTGSTIQYTIQAANGIFPYIWAHGWCANTKSALAQNLEKIHYELKINGSLVDLSSALQQDYQRGSNQYCHGYWIAMYGWPSGTTTLEDKTTLTESINDGTSDYPAGTITVIYSVTLDQPVEATTPAPG